MHLFTDLVSDRSIPLVPRIEIRGWSNEVGLRRLAEFWRVTGY
jgi:hypothetical protein